MAAEKEIWQVTIYHSRGGQYSETVRGSAAKVERARANAISSGISCSGMREVELSYTVEFFGPKGWEIHDERLTLEAALRDMQAINSDDLWDARVTAEYRGI